jgi:hypothetical protein
MGLEFLDTLEQFVNEHGHFDSATCTAHFGNLAAVLEETRSFTVGWPRRRTGNGPIRLQAIYLPIRASPRTR